MWKYKICCISSHQPIIYTLKFALLPCSPTKFSLWHASAALGNPKQLILFLITFQNLVILAPWAPPGLLAFSSVATSHFTFEPTWFQKLENIWPPLVSGQWSPCALLTLWLQTLGHTANRDFWLTCAILHFGASLQLGASLHLEHFPSVANPHLGPSIDLSQYLLLHGSQPPLLFIIPPCLGCCIASNGLSQSPWLLKAPHTSQTLQDEDPSRDYY